MPETGTGEGSADQDLDLLKNRAQDELGVIRAGLTGLREGRTRPADCEEMEDRMARLFERLQLHKERPRMYSDLRAHRASAKYKEQRKFIREKAAERALAATRAFGFDENGRPQDWEKKALSSVQEAGKSTESTAVSFTGQPPSGDDIPFHQLITMNLSPREALRTSGPGDGQLRASSFPGSSGPSSGPYFRPDMSRTLTMSALGPQDGQFGARGAQGGLLDSSSPTVTKSTVMPPETGTPVPKTHPLLFRSSMGDGKRPNVSAGRKHASGYRMEEKRFPSSSKPTVSGSKVGASGSMR